MKPMPVLHLITELDAGGAQTALLRLLEKGNRLAFLPLVACLYNGDKMVAQQIRALGISVIDLHMPAPWRVDALWRLYRLLRQQQPCFLHCWMFHADISGRVIGRLAGVPVIITSRRSQEIGGPNRERLKRLTGRLDDKIIAVSSQARQAEIERTGAPPAKVLTVYNGIECDRFVRPEATAVAIRQEFNIPLTAPVVGMIGRLHPVKGHTFLLSALARLRQTYADVHLLIVGDGALRPALISQVAEEGLATAVTFTGTRADMPDILAALDIVVLPSLWEGLPNVVLEAMAAAKPVVATAVGGTPEVVVDGITGLLVPPGDVAALAEALAALLADPARAKTMGAAGRQHVESHFTLAQTVKAIENVYQTLWMQKQRTTI